MLYPTMCIGDSEDEEVPLVIDDEMEVSQPADQLSDENNE